MSRRARPLRQARGNAGKSPSCPAAEPLVLPGSCSGLAGHVSRQTDPAPGQTQQHSLGLLPCSWESTASGSSSSSAHPALSRLSARAWRQRESGISMPLYWAGTTYCSSLGHRSCREEPGNSPHWHFHSAQRRKGWSAFPSALCASAHVRGEVQGMRKRNEKCPEGKKWPQQQGREQLTLVIPLRETSSEPRMSTHRA